MMLIPLLIGAANSGILATIATGGAGFAGALALIQAACSVPCAAVIAAGGVLGPLGWAGGGIACLLCAVSVGGFCFDPSTRVSVLRNGEPTVAEVEIVELGRGDFVETLKNGLRVPTKVTFAQVNANATVEFVAIVLENGLELKVTIEHGLLVVRDGTSTIVKASNAKVGDRVETVKGLSAVTRVKKQKGVERVTIGTSSGTVLAGGVLVSTLCGVGFEDGTPFDEALAVWQKSHDLVVHNS
jgi:hypothetical protein